MFTQRAAGRVFDFNREVKLTPAWRSRTMVSVAVGEGDAVYVVNRGTDYHPNLPWNHAMRGNRLSKITVGTEVDDEQFLAQFGTDGDSPGQFTWPVAVALDSQENGYVTDEWLNRVSIFDKEGQFLGFWGKGGSGEGEFDGPSGIAFDRNEELFIVDSRNHRVQRYTKQGEFLGQWGKEGSGPGEFNKPWGLTIDRSGAIYVADHKNHRVQKLSPDGEMLASFGSYGSADGQLNRPSDVAVDPDGDIYVCDWANDRVQVFAADGQFITSLLGDANELSKVAMTQASSNPETMKELRETTRPELLGRFSFPTGATFDTVKQRLIVTDSQRGRLQIYDKSME